MAQVLVRNLEEDVKRRIRQRAQRHGRSLEDEVRHILRSAALDEEAPAAGLGTRIVARFRKHGLEADLPELHGQAPRPAGFGR